MPKILWALLALFYCVLTNDAYGDNDSSYDVKYTVELIPKKGYALVTLDIQDASLLTKLDFTLNPKIHKRIKANGELKLSKTSASWSPPQKNAKLQLQAKISHKRSKGKFDALMTRNWAIFRGDDLIPPAKVASKKGAKSKSYLSFILPKGWQSVETGWQRDKSIPLKKGQKNAPHFIIDNPERRFDRPTGWMIAGNIGTRRTSIGNTTISVSAPTNTLFHRMDILTYLSFLWPEIEKAFGSLPEKLLIVGGDDPMWRGGLSASNSLFLHADRPLVSENGTSTLLHEIVHMTTRIRGYDLDDWIAEGLAEYYSIELLHRSGGINQQRKDIVKQKLSDWSKGVNEMRIKQSSGPVTAKATLVFYALDKEIRERTAGRKGLDDLTRALMIHKKVSFQILKGSCTELTGKICETLEDI